MIYDNNEITAVSYSGYNIVRIYSCGGELVFGNEPTPPIFKGKFMAEYSSGDTYNLECNGSSTLVRSETHPAQYDQADMRIAVIGDCVTRIGDNALNELYNLTSVVIPVSVTEIGKQAFSECDSLTNIAIPSGVTLIDNYAFMGCERLVNINIPSGVTSINKGVFNGCVSLTSIDIPSSITSIEETAFYGCSTLTSLEIPSSVSYIGNSAFNSCTRLNSITVLRNSPPSLGNSAFFNTNSCPIFVQPESVDAYKSAWSSLASRIQAIV